MNYPNKMQHDKNRIMHHKTREEKEATSSLNPEITIHIAK